MEILIDETGAITGWQIDPVSIASLVLVIINTGMTRKALCELYRTKIDTLRNNDLLAGIRERVGFWNDEEE